MVPNPYSLSDTETIKNEPSKITEHILCEGFWTIPSSEVAISGIVIRTIVLLLSSWKYKTSKGQITKYIK